jgi:ABC-type glutathione transport system ATPase component
VCALITLGMEGIFIEHEVLIIPTNSDTIIIIYDCNSVKSGVPTSIYSTIP